MKIKEQHQQTNRCLKLNPNVLEDRKKRRVIHLTYIYMYVPKSVHVHIRFSPYQNKTNECLVTWRIFFACFTLKVHAKTQYSSVYNGTTKNILTTVPVESGSKSYRLGPFFLVGGPSSECTRLLFFIPFPSNVTDFLWKSGGKMCLKDKANKWNFINYHTGVDSRSQKLTITWYI